MALDHLNSSNLEQQALKGLIQVNLTDSVTDSSKKSVIHHHQYLSSDLLLIFSFTTNNCCRVCVFRLTRTKVTRPKWKGNLYNVLKKETNKLTKMLNEILATLTYCTTRMWKWTKCKKTAVALTFARFKSSWWQHVGNIANTHHLSGWFKTSPRNWMR